jgi:hypothetical protein
MEEDNVLTFKSVSVIMNHLPGSEHAAKANANGTYLPHFRKLSTASSRLNGKKPALKVSDFD